MNESDFIEAAEKGDLDTVQSLVDKVVSVNNKHGGGKTALYKAAASGSLDVVRFLLTRQDVDVDLCDDDGYSPLHVAVYKGHDALVTLLLANGADVTKAANDGKSPLYIAARNGRDAMVAVLLSHGSDVNQADKGGKKPIDVTSDQKIKDMFITHTKKKEEELQWFQAAMKGDLALIQQGINNKIDINCRDSGGRTAMYHAASEGHLELMEYLITQHADLSIATKPGWLALHIAAFNGHDTVVAALISKVSNINATGADGWSALHCAAYTGHEAALNVLLLNGANVNQANKDGRTPLHEAADRGQEALVTALVKGGADVNQTDNDGDRPIDVAKKQTIKDILIPLTTVKQEDEQQPGQGVMDEAQWIRAAKKGNLALIQQGINDKIDINCRDSGGRTAVYHAASEGHLELTKYLITQHADMSIASKITGNGPLHMAAFKSHDAVVAVLLSHGADINQPSKDGSSPILIAANNGCDAVVAVLLSHGADSTQRNNNGHMPIDVAKSQTIKDMLIAHTKKKEEEKQEPGPKKMDELQWFQATMKGDLTLVQEGINDKIDINCRDSRGRTATYWAAQDGHVQLLEYLITQQADLNIASTDGGLTALSISALKGNVDVVSVLLSNGANSNHSNFIGWAPLHFAAHNGHVAVVAVLLSNNANINQTNNDGWSPLHEAAHGGKEAVVALLIERGADVNQTDNDGDRPIDVAKMQTIKDILIPLTTEKQEDKQQPGQGVMDEAQWIRAAKKGNLALIQKGINNKININCQSDGGRTALFYAAQEGHLELAEYLISQHADLNITTDDGRYPLHIAVYQGHVAVIAALLHSGANVNSPNKDGITPVFFAAYNGQESALNVLLQNGADVNQANVFGRKPIDVAKTQTIKDILIAHTKKKEEEEKQHPDQPVPQLVDESQWFQAAKKGDLALVQEGINDKIDINCQDFRGRTATYWAAQEGHVQLLEYLITQHADLNIASTDGGLTALSIGASNGNVDVVSVLLSNGANSNHSNFSGWAPLHFAAFNGDVAVVAVLLSNNANINQANNDGWSPLHEAAHGGKEAVVALLIERGADVNQTDNDGDRPIDVAKMQTIKDILIPLTTEKQEDEQQPGQGVPKVVDEAQWFRAAKKGNLALIQKGINDKVDINCQNNRSRTALYCAAQEGHLELAEYLITQHADLNITTDDGRYPLHIAVYHGHVAIIAALLHSGANVNSPNKDGSSPLFFAAYNGQESALNVLLQNGADVNQANVFGRKPIDVAKTQTIKDILIAHTKKKEEEEKQHPDQAVPKRMDELQWFQATMKGDLALVQEGINDKIDINCQDFRGRTATYWAAQEGHVQLLEYLITQHADLNIASTDGGLTALSIGASNGNVDVVSVLLSNGANSNHSNFNGWAPLHFAAYNGHIAVVAVLLSNNANINQANNDGWSPLHEAAHGGKEAVVALLIERGADVNQTDNDGDRPIDVAKMQAIKDILIPLTTEKQEDKQQPGQGVMDEAQWFRAAKKGNLALIQKGINDKININCQNNRGRTALFYAAQEDHLELLEYLISQHADLNITTDDGWYPLHIAAYQGHVAIIAALLHSGANVNSPNKDGTTPVFFAAYNDQESALNVLLQNGADVNQANVFGRKPIDVAKTQTIKDILIAHTKKEEQPDQPVPQLVDESQWFQAAKKGDLAVIQQGINNKIDVNCRDSYGYTAVTWAAWIGHLPLLEYLLTQHGDLSIATNGISPLTSATIEGHRAVIDFLLSKGVDVNETNTDGWGALHFAAFNGHEGAVAALLSHGANINQANKDGRTPLHEAADRGQEAVVAVLIERGADVNHSDNDGDRPIDVAKKQTIKDILIPLTTVKPEDEQQPGQGVMDEAQWIRAAKKGNLALIQQGINDKININCRGSRGRTAVYHAAFEGHLQLVEYLITQHADLNITTDGGWTPMLAAITNGHLAIIAALLNNGSNINQLANAEGWTLLHFAVYFDQQEVISFLLSKGASINQVSGATGQTVLDLAKNQKIKDMLLAHMKKEELENVAVDGDDKAMNLLLDEFIADCIEDDVPKILMQMAIEKGEKEWGRSTVMFVGAGRAGKTGTERSMLGYAFEHTESTVGINNEYMFEVTSEFANVDGDAHITGESRWLLAQKAEKEYESALAKLASAIQQGKVKKALERKVAEQKAKLQALKKNLPASTAATTLPIDTLSLSAPLTSTSIAQPALPSPTAVPPDNGAGGGSSIDSTNDPLSPLSVTAPHDVDLEYALRMLAKDLQMNSKLLLTFLDFGGQKAFESINQFFMVEQAVYVVVFNMECFLTLDDRISVNPEKGITTWVECLKVALHWLNTVVVHTMKQGNTKPAPIFIVGTHKDTVSSSADHQAISEALMTALGEYNPVLNSLQHNETDDLCFYPIDNTLGRSDRTMTALMKCIETVIDAQEYVHKMLPLMWFRVLDWMNGQSRFHLLYDEVATFAKECGFDMSTTQAVDDMLSMFHECSVLMWHNVEGLRHIVILSPIQFFVAHATNLLRQHTGTATDSTKHKLPKSIENKIKSDTVLRSDFAQMISTGIITRRLLDVLLSESEEPQVVVQLMITYALLVPLEREGGDVSADGSLLQYLVPSLLPDGTNDMTGQDEGHRFFLFFSVTGAISDDCLRHGDMRDKGFLPGGLFSRLVARLLVWSQETTNARTWNCDKDNVTLFFGAQKFLVTNRPDINAIRVSIFDQHTPLAIHARLDSILEVLKAECFKSLNMATLVEYSGDTPVQGVLRPSSSIRWLVPLSAIRKSAVFLGGGSQGVRRLTAVEVETLFDPWIVRTGASDVELYDLFFSHRWDWNDKLFVRKLVDLLAQFTTGDNPPRAIVSFLDVHSLEMGLNFQEAFVGALIRSRVMVAVVSHAALARMMTHDDKGNETTILTREDNVLVEWLCALRMLYLKQIHVMPVFFGKRTFANGVGGSFFEMDTTTSTSILQRLPDIVAEPTVTVAVELMTKAGVWSSGSVVEPSAFGLSSLSVRAIVTAMTSQMGIQACDSKNPSQLLRSCANQITGILSKGAAAAATGRPTRPSLGISPVASTRLSLGSSPVRADSISGILAKTSVSGGVLSNEGNRRNVMAGAMNHMNPAVFSATSVLPADSPYDAAWSVLLDSDPEAYLDYPQLQQHLKDFGITEACLLEYLDADDGDPTMVNAIVSCLKPIRRKQFMTMLAKAKA